MAKKPKQSAFSIIELLVVILIIASLTGLAIPAINMIQKSYNSIGSKNLISAALSTARTIAMNKQRYAGVRFQKAYTPNEDDKYAADLYDGNEDYIKKRLLDEDQYMIFIVYEERRKMRGDKDCFRVVKGRKPIKLPEAVGVMDMTGIDGDGDIDNDANLMDGTAFSIVFSPAGKLVIYKMQTRNKDGYATGTGSEDQVFNTLDKIKDTHSPAGLFIQDNDENDIAGLKQELSQASFVIYDRKIFSEYLNNGDEYSEYLKNLKENESLYINAYTGAIIDK